MVFRWDAEQIDASERVTAIAAMLRERWADVELTVLAPPSGVRAQVTGWDLGLVRISSVTAAPVVAERRRSAGRADRDPHLVAVVQRSGSSVVRLDGRELVLRPGDLTVYSSDDFATHTFVDEVDVDIARVPTGELGLSRLDIQAVSAVNLLERTPLARVARNLIADLSANPLPRHTEASLAGPVIDILTEALEAAARREEPAVGDRRAEMIVRFVLANLSDAGLNAQMIARHHHISERHLYAVLARADIQLSTFIRRRRLRDARSALARSATTDVSIGQLAQQHGFVSASHFSRTFRQEFGMTPREWRTRRVSTRTP